MSIIQHNAVTGTDLHGIVAFSFASIAARNAQSVVAGDIGKVAQVLADNSFYVLTSVNPSGWSPLGGALASVAATGSYTDLTNAPALSFVALSGSYNDLTNLPALSTVATTGLYSDLINKPTIPTAVSQLTNDSSFQTATQVSAAVAAATPTWSTITGKPTFATIATSGSYADLTNKPSIPTAVSQLTNDSGFQTSTQVSSAIAAATPSWTSLTGKPTFATVATSGSYADLTNKPTAIANLTGGTVGSLPYQSAVGTTSFIDPGTATYVLTSNGTGSAPSWQVSRTPAYPANQIVYGTGTGSSAYSSLTYDPTSNILSVGGLGQAIVESGTGQSLALVSDTSVIITVGGTNNLVIDTSGAFAINGSVGTTGQVFASAGTGAAAGWTSTPTFVATNLTGTAAGMSIGGNAATVTHGVYTTDSGTVTNTMLAGSIANAKLANSSVTIGSTNIALGTTAASLSGLTSVAATTFTGAFSGALTGSVTGLSAPVNASDAATKSYVDSAIAGLSWKNAVVVATTANITLSGTQTIDGVAVTAGNRVLVKNQSTASANGIYVAAAGAWTRATDADVATEINGSAVFVEQGTTNANTAWTQTATITTIGTDTVTYAQFSGNGAYTGSTGISVTGTTITNTGVTSVAAGTGISLSGTTGAVTITATAPAANTLTGTSLASSVVSSSLTSVGTLANLTVTGTIVGSVSGNAATATTASNIASGAANQLAYQTGAGATSFVAAPTTSSTFLQWTGSAFTWASAGGASVSANNTWTAAQRGAVVALTAGATVTPNFDASNNFSLTANQNFTLANPTGTITPGQSGVIAITQDSTGSRTIAWGSYFVAAGGVKPTLSTAANTVDYVSYYVETATRIFVSVTNNVS